MPSIVIIVLGLYLLAHLYLFLRLRPALPRRRGPRRAAAGILVFLFSTLFLAGLGRRFLPPELSDFFWRVGAWWFGFIFYAILLLLLLDLAGLLVGAGRLLFARGKGRRRFPNYGRKTFLAGGAAVAVLLLAGHFNAGQLRVVSHTVRLKSSCGPIREIDLVLISDLHLGVLVNRGLLRQVVREVDSIRPDLIVLAGDVVDRDTRILEDREVGELLSRLRAPLGVYAVTGNHEFITGADRAVEALSRLGMAFLRDRAVMIGESFYLAGREDVTVRRRGGTEVPLGEVLAGVDRNCPVILLDHQPRRIEEAAAEKVDLILCGHTHHGQFFPLNLVTAALYPVSWGYGEMGETRIYVSGGAGTWGPPVRIGNTPEIVRLRILFNQPGSYL